MSLGAAAGLRLSLGLLTVVPAGQVRVDRDAARAAVLLAPLVGAGVGLLSWLVGAAAQLLAATPLLSASLALGTSALLTRAMHLDGLADLADGLGSARPAAQALEVMRRSDVGPFGVVTLLLVLLVQVAAVAQAYAGGYAAACLVLGAVTGRLVLAWACRPGVPAARAGGLGALVAGTVPTPAAVVATVLVVVAAVGGGAALGAGPGTGPAYGAAVVGGLLAGVLLVRRAVVRLGGTTGDVLGAAVETAGTATVVGLVLLS